MKILYGVQKPDDGHHQRQRRSRSPSRTPADAIDAGHRHGLPALHAGRQPHRARERRRSAPRSCTASATTPAPRSRAISKRLRLRPRPRRAGRDARRRRAPAGRDPQGALPRRADHHPRRADRRAGAAGGRRAVRATCASSRTQGHTLIFISHKLDEVLAVADEITVDPPRHHRRHGASPTDVTARKLAELMVGSELPSPSTEESTVTDQVLLVGAATSSCTTRSGATAARRHQLRHPRGRGARHRRRRGQRPDRAGRDAHGHAPAATGHRPARRQGHQPAGRPASAARPASATSPRTGSGTACCSTRRCGRTASSATRPGRPSVKGVWLDRSGARTDTERIVERVRRPHPRHRHDRPGALRRQPAEVHRRPRDERRPGAADRLPPDPRRRRRRPGGDLGPHQAGPPQRARGAADLRRPRRADRPLRHASR